MWFKKKTIVLSDDNHAYLMYLSIMLKKMGFEVLPTESGEELLWTVRIKPPDMIILDVDMTQIDGIKTLVKLKSSADTASIPVVMVAETNADALRVKCNELGCSAYLVKPIGLNDIHEVIQRFIYAPLGYIRKNMRVAFSGKVMLASGGRSYPNVASVTLSERGIFLQFLEQLPVGTEVVVTIPLDVDKGLSLKGCIIYRNDNGRGRGDKHRGVAVEFRETDPNKLMLVSEYVRGLLIIPSSTDEALV